MERSRGCYAMEELPGREAHKHGSLSAVHSYCNALMSVGNSAHEGLLPKWESRRGDKGAQAILCELEPTKAYFEER